MKLGAGVLSGEAAVAAHQYGYRVVSGGCPSVGIVGGYTQGGGPSSLSGLYGLSADNVLEWEAVTADGRHLIATPSQHTDLYWALSGGGGGSFGVVLSMTVKVHVDGPVSGGFLSFNDSSVGPDTFWDAVSAFHDKLPSLVDGTGASVLYQITKNVFNISLLSPPFTARLIWFHSLPTYNAEVLSTYGYLVNSPATLISTRHISAPCHMAHSPYLP